MVVVQCRNCGGTFSSQSNLNRHLRKVHNTSSEKNCVPYEYEAHINKCLEGCRVSFINIIQLKQHLADVHEKNISEESLYFDSEENFDIWLTKTCKINKVQYFKQVTRRGEDFSTTYYYCNRSGVSQASFDNRKRKPKTGGSCKQGSACTSTIQVRKENVTGYCDVKYAAVHYGHANELQHLRLLPTDRAAIVEKLAKGIPVSDILDSNREDIDISNLKRSDILTKKDINNVRSAYNFASDGVRHLIDSVSVELWVEEFKQNASNTIFYKKKGDEHDFLEKNDICLIFMNSSQEYMLKTYGNNGIICVDTAQDLNSCDFELISISVVDEWGEAIPAACLFTNRKDAQIFQFFFNILKEKLGVITARTLMTDNANVFYKAWCASMQSVSYHIICSWHVDHAWRSNLNKITNMEKRRKVHDALNVIQSEINETSFVTKLTTFLTMLQEDPETAAFGEYFVKNYANRCEQWAYAYRKTAGINANIHLDSMHEYVKYFYLDGKFVKRMDKVIHAVNTYIRDKVIDHMIKELKRNNTFHVTKIEKRHEIALKCQFQVTEKGSGWCVTNDGRNYMISRNPVQTISCCELNCAKCQTCVHTYRCTCVDYFVEATMCKHIHYIILLTEKNDDLPERDNPENSEMLCNIDSIKLTPERVNKKKLIRDSLKQQCLEVFKLDLSNVDDDVILHTLKMQKTICSLLKSCHHVGQNEYQSVTDTTVDEPSNKKAKKQLNFSSTKRKETEDTMLSKCNYKATVLLSKENVLSDLSEEHNYT